MMTPDVFILLFPEFANVPPATIQVWLNQAALLINIPLWDNWADSGVAYLAAHELFLSQQRAAKPSSATADVNLLSKAGDVQRQRSEVMLTKHEDNPYLTTKYGQKYLYFMRMVGVGGTVV